MAVVAVLGVGAAGMVSHAPVYLPALPAGAPPLPDEKTRVFGYATLADPLVRLVVVGRPVTSDAAGLPGWRRVGRDLAPDPEAVTQGRVFYVTPEGLRRLDRYEQTGFRYSRTKKMLDDGSPAWVYGLLTPRGAR